MDATSDTANKPKLEELSHVQLIVLLKEASQAAPTGVQHPVDAIFGCDECESGPSEQ